MTVSESQISSAVKGDLRGAGDVKATTQRFSSSLPIATDTQDVSRSSAQSRIDIQGRLRELQALLLAAVQSEAVPPATLNPDSSLPESGGGNEQMEELRRTIAQQEEEIARLQPPAYEQAAVRGD